MRDSDAFQDFVLEYQDMVFATALRLTGNRTEAEDIAQTVFLRAFERFADLGNSPAVAGWLKTVATNASLSHLSRYRARWQFFSELASAGEAEGAGFESRLSSESTTVRDLERAEEYDQLERALHRLPDHQRVPIVLFHFDDQSYEQIALKLGVSLGKIKTDIHRGREALRKQIERSAQAGTAHAS